MPRCRVASAALKAGFTFLALATTCPAAAHQLPPRLRGSSRPLQPQPSSYRDPVHRALGPAPSHPKDPHCFEGGLQWSSKNGELLVNGQVFHLKGTNWYGCETEAYSLQGLDVRKLEDVFKFLQDRKFNALRIPFSLKFAKDPENIVNQYFQDDTLRGLTRFGFMDKIIETAAAHNMLVMLDLHRLNDQFIPQLWYDQDDTIEDVMEGWDTVLDHFTKHWNVFAIDLKNEPFGNATWASGDNATDWNVAAQMMGIHVLENHPDWQGLIFVEGINYSTDFRGFKDHPIDFGKKEWNERMILSPHQYGPSVVQLDMFFNDSFPANMPEEWTSHWGFLEEYTGRAAVLGEWGGRYVGLDKIWQDAFSDYLIDMCLSDQFQWDLNPTSADTGGLLEGDWTTPESAKLDVLDRVQPDPSFLSKADGEDKICLTPGSYANPKCAHKKTTKPHKPKQDVVPPPVAPAVVPPPPPPVPAEEPAESAAPAVVAPPPPSADEERPPLPNGEPETETNEDKPKPDDHVAPPPNDEPPQDNKPKPDEHVAPPPNDEPPQENKPKPDDEPAPVVITPPSEPEGDKPKPGGEEETPVEPPKPSEQPEPVEEPKPIVDHISNDNPPEEPPKVNPPADTDSNEPKPEEDVASHHMPHLRPNVPKEPPPKVVSQPHHQRPKAKPKPRPKGSSSRPRHVQPRAPFPDIEEPKVASPKDILIN